MKPAARLRSGIVAGGLVLVAAFAGSAAWDGWRLHQQVLDLNAREMGNLARALAGEAARNLQAVDVLLRDTAIWYEALPRTADALAVNSSLDARAAGAPQVSVLAIVAADGQQTHRSRAAGRPLTDTSARAYFRRQREDAQAGLVIDGPLLARTEGQAAVVVSRRLARPDGGFDGVVAATVRLDALQQAYAAIALGAGSRLLLAQPDGSVLVQLPGDAAGQRMPDSLARLQGPAVQPWTDPADGRLQLAAVVPVGPLPLRLAITRERDTALQPWRQEMRSAAARVLAVGLLVALAATVLLRQLRQRDEAARERERLEQRLQQTARMEALGQLAGGIAHDFNNILSAILGFGDMAQQEAPPGSALRRHIDRVLEGGQRARLLVQGILDFSRSGVAEPLPVHVQSLLAELAALLAEAAPPGVQVQVRLQAGDSAVLGDATQIYRVAMNLCSNAIQAVADGGEGAGTVALTLERLELPQPRELSHGELRAGAHVCLTVQDDGPGIPPEVQARMFEPFFTTRRPGQGTGLGLAVAHGIVLGMGGAIDVQSAPGAGTRIAVWLPSPGHCAAPTPTPAAEPADGQGRCIMVVDDERALVELAEETLAGLGYEPVGYASAEHALEAFAAAPDRFDAVLSDETLPGLSGSVLAQRLRAQRPGLPVLLMSGQADAALAQRARVAGVHAVLPKPLARHTLAAALASALRKDARPSMPDTRRR
ncbi:ATP-binding protein [Pseudorhodoferax soli]|uniref:histidine kinase n=1 Tax=Pseudorhodoferax soli TaxID=545864 RepID=A0A368XAU2_9BURK|nr:ATP-binding protein [Pseudorhodoferax soli]RCW64128.1 signal transduction histidine kinase [Pseudorhodoferax soli]